MPPDRPRAAIVHDARNALATALGRLQLLRRHLDRGDQDRAAEDAVEAEHAIRRASRSLDDLDDAGAPGSDRR